METENLSPNDLRQQRIENMHKLEQAGYSAFGSAFARDGHFDELSAGYEDGKSVKLAGRIMTCREMG
ncbi:MAG: hypothetical protein ACO3N7_07605 [Kiritimatiellia bacterium]